MDMDQEHIIRSLRLQLRIERIAIAAIAFALLACWAWGNLRDTRSLIVVDGRPVVCVLSERDAEAVLREIKSETGCNPSEIEFAQEVVVARAPRGTDPVSRHKAMRVVERVLCPVVPRWAIIVDGEPVVAVASREAAGEVLDRAKLKFGKMVKNLAEEPQFKEHVKVDVAAVAPSLYCKTADAALKMLFAEAAPVSKDAAYTIGKGDIASTIAARNGIKLEDLWAMNPGVDLHRLQIGDKIRIKAKEIPKPKLTVVVRDQDDRIEAIPAPVQRVSSARMYNGKTAELSPGRSGERRVKVAAIYENGRKVGSEVIEEVTIREPVPRRIAVGIKPLSSR